MVDRHAAERIANAFLNSPHWNQTDDHFVIINDATIEKDYGWIFFYQSERYLQTSELRYSLSGNTPIVVERADGAVQVLPIFVCKLYAGLPANRRLQLTAFGARDRRYFEAI